MKIFSYLISMPDDVDTLPDALDSLAKFCDRIFVVDGLMGEKTLSQHPRFLEPLRDWIITRDEFGVDYNTTPNGLALWNGVPLTLYENEFKTPGGQRNYILGRMAQEPEQPNWVVWIDSDEICSNEFISDIRPYLEGLPPDISNVCPKWLTLIQDEQHYAPAHSGWLSHARIHHPGIARWVEQWHEHMNYVGQREAWDRKIIHTRMLFRRRLFVQRGHAVVNEGAWSNVTAVPVPAGITWNMHWPESEPIGMPFDSDIRIYQNGKWATVEND